MKPEKVFFITKSMKLVLTHMLQKIYQVLASKKLAIALFAGICIVSIPGTFMKERDTYSSLLSAIFLVLMGLNLSLCTFRRRKSLPKTVIIMHVGSILVLAGSLISSFGFVATANITEGTSSDMVYRPDLGKDVPLGMNLSVEKMNTEYYPVPVRVGVLKGNEKHGLFELKTGESFKLGDIRVKADGIEFSGENLKLSIFDGNQLIGHADTSGNNDLPQQFPYSFVLVAFRDPAIKREWVDLKLDKGNETVAVGHSEVNTPLKWNDLRFYYIGMDRDKYGFALVGIQIVRDPGRPYIYFGFCVMGLGAIWYLVKKIYRPKQ